MATRKSTLALWFRIYGQTRASQVGHYSFLD
jgi:hypothetical protein